MYESNTLRGKPSDDFEFTSLLKQIHALDKDTPGQIGYALEIKGDPEFLRSTLTRSLSNCYENIRNLSSANDALTQAINNARSLLCSRSGGIILDSQDLSASFFEKGRTSDIFGYTSGRGARYYVFSTTFLSKEERIKILEEELSSPAVHSEMLSIESSSLAQKIAIADYLKNLFITMFHAYTYPQRFGHKPNADVARSGEALRGASEYFTRVYYSLLLNYVVDTKPARRWLALIQRLWEQELKPFMGSDSFEGDWLKYAELDDPIAILQAAHSFVLEDHTFEVVVGLESGGTELAYVTKWLHDIEWPKTSVKSITLPISRYTLQRSALYNGTQTPAAIIRDALANCRLNGKNILIVDDNANTGESMQLAFDTLLSYQPKSIRVRVAEFDIHRSIYKHRNWEKRPEHVANPMLFVRSVGITPITQGLDNYLPFKQMRKITRLMILQDYYKQLLTKVTLPVVKTTNSLEDCKVCGVHNIHDFVTTWNTGIRWFGIHCLYDDNAYKLKLDKLPLSHKIEYELSRDFVVGQGTGLPLMEVSSIRTMLEKISELSLKPRIVFLIDGNNTLTVPAICKHLIPDNYHEPIYFQLQNTYSAELTRRIVNQATSNYKYGVSLVQTFGSTEAPELLPQLDKDPLIDFILIDYKQRGGTGKSIDVALLRTLITLVHKQFFIAGGISAKNVQSYASSIGDIAPDFLIDLESSVEYRRSVVRSRLDLNGNPITLRKSPTKTKSLAKAWHKTIMLLKKARDYEALALEGTSFKKALNTAWLRAKDEYGYFAVTPTIKYFLHSYLGGASSNGLDNYMVHALINYDHLPSYYSQAHMAYDYIRGEQLQWIVKGVPEFVRTITSSLINRNGRLIVWTSGEDSANSAGSSDSYAQVDEQRKKFNRSGLENILIQSGLREGSEYEFVASPNKVAIINRITRELPKGVTVIVADDNESNLEQARQILEENGRSCYKTILIGGNPPLNHQHLHASRIVDIIPLIKPDCEFVLFCDMDGVLLHEHFRNEHQPKNLYYALKQYGSYPLSEALEIDSPSPVVLIEKQVDLHFKRLVIIGATPETASSWLYREENFAGFSIVPTIATYRELKPSMHNSRKLINTAAFRHLLKRQLLAFYVHSEKGYIGVLREDIERFNRANNGVLVVLDFQDAYEISSQLKQAGVKLCSVALVQETKTSPNEVSSFNLVARNKKEFRSLLDKINKEGGY